MRSLTAVVAAALVLLPAAPAWAANSAPVVVDDAVDLRSSVVDAAPVPVDALANDSDPDGDALAYTAVTPATKGTASLEGGRLMYRPQFRAEGTDSFTYTVTDGQGNSATGTVAVTLWVDPDLPGNPTITIPGTGSVTLTWSAAPRADQYRVYRDDALVHTTSGLTWTDTGLLDASAYRYSIAGVNGGGWESVRQDLYRNQRLMTPSGLTVTPIDNPTSVSLIWQRHSSWGPWFVYRDGVHVATTDLPQFRDDGLVTGRQYGYQIQRVDRPTPFDYDVSPASALTDVVRATPVSLSRIAWLYLQRGAEQSDLGAVTVPERAVPGGRQQDHVNGLIVQRDGGPAHAVLYDFATTYGTAGGVSGDLGFPVSSHQCDLRDGGCAQFFEGGSLWSHQNSGTRIVRLDVQDAWDTHSRQDGRLGYPVADEVCDLRGEGCFQEFQGGALYSSPETGVRAVSTPYLEVWGGYGWEDGPLGYPVADEVCGLRAGGCGQVFQGGYIHWSPTTGMHAVGNAYAQVWGRYAGEAGPLGYPVAGEVCGLPRGGCAQVFQGGYIHWSPATGMHAVGNAYARVWGRYGGESGPLGYPVAAEVCGLPAGGCGQQFQGGYIYWSPSAGMHAVGNAYAQVWGRYRGESGRMGYPVADEVCGLPRGGCFQQFQDGAIYWSPASGIYPVFGGIRDLWAGQGRESGRLGYPIGPEIAFRGVYRQFFEGGIIGITARGPRITYNL